MKIVAIVLTRNETKHIRRCIENLREVASEILVVDSFSTDDTVSLARELGARVLEHPFKNYATQFNWALDQVDPDADWVIRIDADEYFTGELGIRLRSTLAGLDRDTAGVYINRWMVFQGRHIRWGGMYPIEVLRIWRHGSGRCEIRWMDEHIIVEGATIRLSEGIVDDNQNPLSWWTDKHNSYSNREAVDLLNLKYRFMPSETVASLQSGNQAGVKRWVKEKVYARMPAGLRALGYFIYRYVIRAGFLDGKPGLAFHVLQGFWYRFLVDAKFHEVERCMKEREMDVVPAIRAVLGIDVRSE